MIAHLEPLEGSERSEADLRAEVIAEHLAKRDGLAGPTERSCPSVALLNLLYMSGHLYLDTAKSDGGAEAEIAYVPSSGFIDHLINQDPAVAGALGSRSRKAIRATEGALITLPGLDGETSIDVFTTDWSPSASACAVAVHPLHPVLSDCPERPVTGAAFTGKFVRHPLTGDILPVWCADWVKAGFGTGAVLVNPAHDANDLAFAQRVGLPVRFSLLPDGASDDPGSWPEPPVIKTGRVTRAGPFDDMTHEAAQHAFLQVLRERGLATPTVDRSLPPVPIARVRFSDTGAYSLLKHGRLVETAEAGDPYRVDLEFNAVYRCVARALKHGAHTIVASAPSMKKVGPALVGMLVDAGREPSAIKFVVSGPVECNLENVPEHVFKIALLVGGKISEPAVVNRQLLDQVEGFLEATRRCREELAGGDAAPPKDVMTCFEQGDPKSAFQSLRRWQKDCLKSGRAVDVEKMDEACALFSSDVASTA